MTAAAPRNRSLRTLALFWVPPLVWTVLLFVVSGGEFTMGRTATLLLWVFRLLHLPLAHFDLIHAGLRKTGHFIGYAILGALLFRAWRVSLPGPRQLWLAAEIAGRSVLGWLGPAWRARWAALAVAAAALVATGDEINQLFVPGRSSSPRDIALDTLGALFAQALLLAWFYRKPWAEQ